MDSADNCSRLFCSNVFHILPLGTITLNFFIPFQAESALPRAALDSGLNYCKGLFYW